MKMSCKIQIVPSYRFENLTELQYKALCWKMLDYSHGFYNDGIQVTGFGNKKLDGSYYYDIGLDTHVAKRVDFEINRDEGHRITEVTENLLKYMDEIIEEFKKVIELNEEFVSA